MNTHRHVSRPYEPVIDSDSKILILGTTPSVKSSELGFYYMHPQNRFWKVLGSLIEEDLYNSDKLTKQKILKEHKIAISDVIYSCDIIASDDSQITNIVINDIYALLKNSAIEHIFLNGSRAYQEFAKHFASLLPISTLLPSTSPRNARYSLEDLISSWQVILQYIESEKEV